MRLEKCVSDGAPRSGGREEEQEEWAKRMLEGMDVQRNYHLGERSTKDARDIGFTKPIVSPLS